MYYISYVLYNSMHEYIRSAGGSLSRISALGADGGALASSLSLWGMFFPFLVYKTRVINILQRLFILIGGFLGCLLGVLVLGLGRNRGWMLIVR